MSSVGIDAPSFYFVPDIRKVEYLYIEGLGYSHLHREVRHTVSN